MRGQEMQESRVAGLMQIPCRFYLLVLVTRCVPATVLKICNTPFISF